MWRRLPGDRHAQFTFDDFSKRAGDWKAARKGHARFGRDRIMAVATSPSAEVSQVPFLSHDHTLDQQTNKGGDP